MSRIIVLVGLPGAGKSSWVAQQPGAVALSSDEIRRWLCDDITNQTIHRRVFATLRFLLRHRLELDRPQNFIDATNLTRKDRRPYIKMADLYGCAVESVYFDIPLEVCLARNRSRARVVPEEAMLEMARRLIPPALNEGFSRITVIRPEDAQGW